MKNLTLLECGLIAVGAAIAITAVVSFIFR